MVPPCVYATKLAWTATATFLWVSRTVSAVHFYPVQRYTAHRAVHRGRNRDRITLEQQIDSSSANRSGQQPMGYGQQQHGYGQQQYPQTQPVYVQGRPQGGAAAGGAGCLGKSDIAYLCLSPISLPFAMRNIAKERLNRADGSCSAWWCAMWSLSLLIPISITFSIGAIVIPLGPLLTFESHNQSARDIRNTENSGEQRIGH